tara:strand:+ start:2853 stop:3191 length:339 start_codon:yes stop_codon:yes gene_type:complete
MTTPSTLLANNMVNENFIIQFGKYKSKNIVDIFDLNPNYCQWLLKQPLLNKYPDIKEYLEEKLINPNEHYMTFGKYKGKALSDIKKNDPKYIDYLKTNDFIKTRMVSLYEAL